MWGKRTLFDICSVFYCKFGRILVLFRVVEDSHFDIYTSFKNSICDLMQWNNFNVGETFSKKTLINRFSN